MKNILFVILLFLVSACSNDDITSSAGLNENRAKLAFGVTIPDVSSVARSIGDEAINSLYLVVFDENGYLSEYQKAVLSSSASKTSEYNITLYKSDKKRSIHFIANYDIENLKYEHESNLIASMTTSNNKEAYWQRMELSGGINETTDLGTVSLVRNFVKICIENTDKDFTIEGWAVINVKDKGSVAPYNMNGQGQFVNFASELTYEDIDGQGYKGFEPSDAALINTEVNSPEWIDKKEATYMYERIQPKDETLTYLLVKGHIEGKLTKYYKIDIVYTDQHTQLPIYYNLIRNFEYTISINSVTEAAGYDTPYEASIHNAGNNLTSSVIARNLLNISDGEAQLFVSYTDMTLVSDDAVELKYRYYPNVKDKSKTDNDKVRIKRDNTNSVIVSIDPSPNQDESIQATTPDSEGYSVLKIYPKTPGDTPLEEKITLYVGELSREVNFTLRKKRKLIVNCTPQVASRQGEEVTVTANISAALTSALFPLTFTIEAEKLSIYPDPKKGQQLPVKVGKSIIPSKSGQTETVFAYEKTITYQDYMNLSQVTGSDGSQEKVFYCYFLTNTAYSATNIYVYNKYFDYDPENPDVSKAWGKTSFANY